MSQTSLLFSTGIVGGVVNAVAGGATLITAPPGDTLPGNTSNLLLGQLPEVTPGINAQRMAVAEDQLHPIPLVDNLDNTHRVIHQVDPPTQARRPAMGTRAARPQLAMGQGQLWAIGPTQVQPTTAGGVADRRWCLQGSSCESAMRTALRTSGSPSCSA